jgi:hypothetical protein
MENRSISARKKMVIHRRNLNIFTYTCEDESRILVEGRLKDDHLVEKMKLLIEKSI